MWTERIIKVPTKDGGTVEFRCQVKHYDEPSEEFGINGGRISKLWMQNNITKETVANYDRGWDIEPDKKNQQVMVAYYLLLKDYN